MSDPDIPPRAARQASILLSILENVARGVQEGRPADRILHQILSRRKKYGSRDRRRIRDAVFCWFRWHGAVGALPLPRGLCAAWALEGIDLAPPQRAVFQDLGWPCPEPPEAELSLEERRERVMNLLPVDLAPVEEWLPTWFRDETAHLGPWEDRIRDHLHRPPTWLRVDHAQQSQLHQALLQDGADWAGPACPVAYAFRDPGKVHQWTTSHADALEIQDLGSQQVVRICHPQPGQTWWDACCGAGGKSLHLLDHAERSLDLTCTDRREEVLPELLKRGRRHGLGKVRRYALDLLHRPELPNIAFDGILLDAPCSGSGTWNRNPDDAWRTEAKDVAQHGRRQTTLLSNVLPALKPGGVLIYAVCSITRTETLDVVAATLHAHPDLALDPFPHPLRDTPTDGTLTLLPQDTRGDGMFIARFLKK